MVIFHQLNQSIIGFQFKLVIMTILKTMLKVPLTSPPQFPLQFVPPPRPRQKSGESPNIPGYDVTPVSCYSLWWFLKMKNGGIFLLDIYMHEEGYKVQEKNFKTRC